MIQLGDHFQPSDDGDSTTYRVVGVTERATLLRVTDADGRRTHTGEIRHVSPDTLEAAFEPAEDPESGFSPASAVENLLQGTYWEIHMYLWSPLTSALERLRR